MKPGYADYGPLAHQRVRWRWHLLRTARLNLIGWLALILLCGTVGVLAGMVAQLAGWPWLVTGACGAVLALAVVVGADRRRWAYMRTSAHWTDDPAEVREVVDLLAQQGVIAEMEIVEGEPRLAFRNRDVRRVRVMLERRRP
jgi:hypothetical protein